MSAAYDKSLEMSSCKTTAKNSDSLIGSTVLQIELRRAVALFQELFSVETTKLRRGEPNEYKPKKE